mmetsp:Transcript_32362/g.53572  ORF Transcript_32362/g.53572 Transcript_32362/m.53572 type:complete len:209 (-) Transcript_32362:107-733(-)
MHFTFQHYRYLLAVESLWLMVPLILGASDWSVASASFAHLATVMCIIPLAMLASTLMLLVDRHPLLRTADRLFARLLFGVLLLLHLTAHAIQPCGICTPALLVMCYLGSRKMMPANCSCRTPQYSVAAAVHLLFRFVGWWYTCWGVTAKRPSWWGVLGSGLYWGHIVYSAEWTTRSDASHFCALRACWRGCVEVSALSGGLVAIALFH